MDTLLILKRPISIVKPNKKNKLSKSKSKKMWPSPVAKVMKKTEGLLRTNKSSCETILEKSGPGSETEHVSFVSLYHDLCRGYYGGSDSDLPPCSVTTILSAGDQARRARAHVVMEIDY